MKYRKVKSEKKLQQVPIYFCRSVLQNGNVCWVLPDKGGRKRGKERKEMFFQISDPISSRTTKTCGLVLLVASTTWCWTYCKQSPHRLWLVSEVPLHVHMATIHQPWVSNSIAKPNSSFHEAMESFYDPALARETLYKPSGEGLRAPQASRSTSTSAALPSDPVPCISVHKPTEGLGGQPSHVSKHVEGRHLILLSWLQHPITRSDEVLHEADNKKSSVVPMLLASLC